jgi:hypothetical protein
MLPQIIFPSLVPNPSRRSEDTCQYHCIPYRPCSETFSSTFEPSDKYDRRDIQAKYIFPFPDTSRKPKQQTQAWQKVSS